jgi:membrane-associated protease RseP (regulator of RpoE activity)
METEEPIDLTLLTPLVARVLKIEDITTGDAKRGYLARYRGQLYGDSAEAYDQLAESLRPRDITPLFRKEKDSHVVFLLSGIIHPKPSNPWVNLLMFALTLASVIYVGAVSAYQCTTPFATQGEFQRAVLRNLDKGIPFAIALLAILVTHEFGHYLAGRYHKTHVTLPYFIPFPVGPFGTMGAFIQLKEIPKNKRILLDIGIAGPIAGLIVAIPILLLGLAISPVETITIPTTTCVVGDPIGVMLEGNSLIYLLSKLAVKGQLLPAPTSYGSLPAPLYWVMYFFTGQPMPIGGKDVMLHPIAWAGWAGLLVTALNLIPAGQLDGGHVMYVLFGSRSRKLLPYILIGMMLLGFFWSGWWLWAMLIFLLGRMYAEPLDQITSLDPRRKALAIFGVILFFLVFTPVPLVIKMLQ